MRRQREMSVSTIATALTVNPAFLEEIKDSNATLWHQLSMLREICESNDVRPSVLHRLVDLLNEVRDLLALQFALEETYGYMEIPAGTPAHFASPMRSAAMPAHAFSPSQHSAEQVRAQHCPLYLLASELAEKAEELQYRGWVADKATQLVNQVKQFELQLQDHERAERRLVDASRQGLRRRR
jgi:hypothetical protein